MFFLDLVAVCIFTAVVGGLLILAKSIGVHDGSLPRAERFGFYMLGKFGRWCLIFSAMLTASIVVQAIIWGVQ